MASIPSPPPEPYFTGSKTVSGVRPTGAKMKSKDWTSAPKWGAGMDDLPLFPSSPLSSSSSGSGFDPDSNLTSSAMLPPVSVKSASPLPTAASSSSGGLVFPTKPRPTKPTGPITAAGERGKQEEGGRLDDSDDRDSSTLLLPEDSRSSRHTAAAVTTTTTATPPTIRLQESKSLGVLSKTLLRGALPPAPGREKAGRARRQSLVAPTGTSFSPVEPNSPRGPPEPEEDFLSTVGGIGGGATAIGKRIPGAEQKGTQGREGQSAAISRASTLTSAKAPALTLPVASSKAGRRRMSASFVSPEMSPAILTPRSKQTSEPEHLGGEEEGETTVAKMIPQRRDEEEEEEEEEDGGGRGGRGGGGGGEETVEFKTKVTPPSLVLKESASLGEYGREASREMAPEPTPGRRRRMSAFMVSPSEMTPVAVSPRAESDAILMRPASGAAADSGRDEEGQTASEPTATLQGRKSLGTLQQLKSGASGLTVSPQAAGRRRRLSASLVPPKPVDPPPTVRAVLKQVGSKADSPGGVVAEGVMMMKGGTTLKKKNEPLLRGPSPLKPPLTSMEAAPAGKVGGRRRMSAFLVSPEMTPLILSPREREGSVGGPSVPPGPVLYLDPVDIREMERSAGLAAVVKERGLDDSFDRTYEMLIEQEKQRKLKAKTSPRSTAPPPLTEFSSLNRYQSGTSSDHRGGATPSSPSTASADELTGRPRERREE
eukprot:GHVU01142763.1.p1 GENE.GHVU01142763.1~~GHVU01142763.1.p1  ORF type:complete len:712 (+),score=127.49 GHVU01142763.1:4433-6568(+)